MKTKLTFRDTTGRVLAQDTTDHEGILDADELQDASLQIGDHVYRVLGIDSAVIEVEVLPQEDQPHDHPQEGRPLSRRVVQRIEAPQVPVRRLGHEAPHSSQARTQAHTIRPTRATKATSARKAAARK